MKFLRIINEKYKSLNVIVKASFWFILVTIIDKAIGIITQPIINRILTVEEVGSYGVFQSWHSIFSIIATLNLFGGVLEVYLTKEKDEEKTIVSSLSTLSLIISLVFLLCIFVFSNSLSNLLDLKASYLYIMVFTIIGEMLVQFWAVSKRFNYSYKVYSLLIVCLFLVKSVLSVLLSYYLVDDRLFGRLLGLCIPVLIVGLILYIISIIQTPEKKIWKYWKKGILFNLPLLPHYLSSVLLASSDKVMIEKITNSTDAGLYTVAYSFASLALIVFSAVNSAYNPFSMKAIKEEKYDELSTTTNVMVLFSIIFSLLLIYLAPEGLFILGGKTYLQSLKIIPVLVVGIFFSSFYFIFSNVEFVYEKNKLIFPITLLGALLNIGLNFWLIPKFGYEVAAYTTFIGYFVIALLHYIVSRFILKRDIYNIKLIVLFLLFFVGLAALGLLLYDVHFLIRYFVVLLLLILFIIYGWKNKSVLFKKSSKDNMKDAI